MQQDEIVHMLLHALTEETLGSRLDGASSQEEVYRLLQTLPYFTLTKEEFRQGIQTLQSETPFSEAEED